MKLRLQAIQDLLSRYGQVFRAAWDIRHQLDAPPRQGHELAFLPAHLELADTPVHPAPRWTMRLIVLFALLAVLWSAFGKLDIVATAHGKLAPNAQVKIIQPLDTGAVRAILVQNGQRVKAGQALVELDATQAGADAAKSRAARLDAAATVVRAQALLDAQAQNHPPRLASIPGLPVNRQAEAQRLAEGQYGEYRDKLAAQQAELLKRQAELDSTRRQIDKLKQTAPLARQSADAYRDLAKDSYVSRQDYLQKEQERISQEQDLAAQQSHARELAAGIEEQRRLVDATRSQFRREQLDELNKAQQLLTQNRSEETKASQRQQRMRLTAPVAGTVQQLAIHTVGGVATQAQALMEIVPDDTLEVEASIGNKDIGFVNADQDAVVKVETFPYTRYGYLTGKIIKVSNDATQDKKLGLVFSARIRLNQSRIKVENKWVNLSPGMAVTVEVKTGQRRVAEYFLSPLVEYAQESFRER
ncbi:HlyD family type I secretion periplasmic adaptor subunit [Chromobacterium alticapitis]|uniref:Membrane fusion protein (MFP) family protein n=1 Tax=Chromobacterium alticapitis TaxID=2073169 RepID=A0A2S5DFY6_9NEIS|nr:HlyD family type I secretion periplasmic adaptor subunit [Chromobacterium alticapitis]POZ61917.1 HlyD family type I secretion periplasmic adaptor subunit [Chromobacterium alticapitis]